LEATRGLVEKGAPLINANKNCETPLFRAARCGKTEVFHYLREIGADINIHDININTAPHNAAISSSVEIIKLLLDKGLSVDLKNAEDSTPLHF
jgi:ankyrin repeat protein